MSDVRKKSDHSEWKNEKAEGGMPHGYDADEHRLREDGTIDRDNGHAPKEPGDRPEGEDDDKD